jgi:hypothetical protein
VRRLVRLLPVPLFVALALALLGAVPASASASASTVWLCKPGASPNPCNPGLSTTVYSPTGSVIAVKHPSPVKNPAIDCFYVYPTVSGQPTGNANLHIDPEENSIALYQAARYSQYCRVFAPMYRQQTLAGIGLGAATTKPNPAIALADVRSAFRDYLEHYNHGRGFVLIGHSQGSFVLRQLIALDVDGKSTVRKRLVSAILLGGNVLVTRGKDIGGDFQHIHACHAARDLGCVVAFSAFDQPVPPNAIFGRPHNLGGPRFRSDEVVLCTNPAALGGGSQIVDLVVPSQPFYKHNPLYAGILILGLTQPMPPTVWVDEPNGYRASCSSANNANVLEVTAVNGAQTPHPSPDASWGLHLLDGSIALGNLIEMVNKQAKAFVASHARHH